jgi:uncharacterized membrane protein YhaH (DUF805 family)
MSMEEVEITEYSEPPQTGFVSAIKKGFRGYVVWNARSTRSEYWWWSLFAIIVALVATVIDSVVFSSNSMTGGIGPVGAITSLALFLPGLSVWIRRLHDTDRTGWWAWIVLIPFVGVIIALVFALLPSKVGPTRWNSRILA